ncbi:MAG: thioester domain-containing protein, partial [Lachnospirales bacterium]
MFKKMFCMLLAMITIFTTVSVQGAEVGDKVTVKTDNTMVQYGLYVGSPIGTAMDYIVDENGEKSYAYCIDHSKQGVSEVGVYDVTLQPYDNVVVEGMLVNGFPNKNYGLTEKQSFYATKMAIVTYLEGWDITKWVGTGGNSAMIAAMQQIYWDGKAYTRPEATSEFKFEQTGFEEFNTDDEQYTYKIVSDTTTDITINLTGDVPTGTKINGTTTNTATIKTNEEFTISYTKPKGDYTKSFKIVVDGEGKGTNVVLG